MGIIKYILQTIIFLSIFCGNAQTIQDTVEFEGDRYIKHIVTVGESLNKIAKLYNIRVKDIIETNEMTSQLYYNQLLYIPIKSSKDSIFNNILVSKKSENNIKEVNSAKLNIALLLPYYLIKNDTMFNNFKDSSEISSIYFNASEVALSFHLGVILALDSLRKTGKQIILHSFDTNKDIIKTREIVESGYLDVMDIIIGPLHSRNFEILCKKYGNNSNKILINPLSRIIDNILDYKSVYQISTSTKEQHRIIKDYIIKKYKNKRVVVLYDKKEENYALNLKKKFRKETKVIYLNEINSTRVDSIRKFFQDFQIVIIPSTNKAFVSKLLASIGSIDSTSIVFGLDSWKRYDNLDIDNLMELDVHLPVSNPFNYNSNHDLAFLRLFEKEYNTNHGKYTSVGYNIIMHFCSKKRLYKFKNIKSNGIKENITAPIFHYKDYQFVPVNRSILR